MKRQKSSTLAVFVWKQAKGRRVEKLEQRQNSIIVERPRGYSKNRYVKMTSFSEELAGSSATRSLGVEGENTVSEESNRGWERIDQKA